MRLRGRPRSFDAEKIEILRQQMLTNQTQKQIAAFFGVSRFTIHKYCKKIKNPTEKT